MPVPTPPIIWKGCHPNNFGAGRLYGGRAVFKEAFVVHTTDGGASIEALDSWFANPQAGVSANFGIGPSRTTGKVEIHQYVSDDDSPFAHGVVNKPTAQIVSDNAANPNYWADGCELVDGGTPGNHSEEQHEMLAWLAAWRFETVYLPHAALTGAAPTRERIIGHYQIDGVNRARCPSLTPALWDWLIMRVQAILAGAAPRPVAPIPKPLPIPPPPAVDEAGRLRAQLITARDGLTLTARGWRSIAAWSQTLAEQARAHEAGVQAVLTKLEKAE